MLWSMGQRFVLLKVRKATKQENNRDVKHLLTNTKADVNKTFDLISGIESLTDIHCM